MLFFLCYYFIFFFLKEQYLILVTHHSRVAGVECGLVALLFSFSSSAAVNKHQSKSNYYRGRKHPDSVLVMRPNSSR